MIICLCRAVSDRIVRELIDQGVNSIVSLRKVTGVGRGCGKCLGVVKDLLDEKTGLLSRETCGTKSPRYQEAKEYHHGQGCE